MGETISCAGGAGGCTGGAGGTTGSITGGGRCSGGLQSVMFNYIVDCATNELNPKPNSNFKLNLQVNKSLFLMLVEQ